MVITKKSLPSRNHIQRREKRLTRRNEKRKALDGILMRRLHPLHLLQPPPTQLPRPHRRLPVPRDVLPRRRVVVEPNGHFDKARAQRAVSEEPVREREGGGVVGGLVLATGGGLEAEEGEDGRYCCCCHGVMRVGFRLMGFSSWLMLRDGIIWRLLIIMI